MKLIAALALLLASGRSIDARISDPEKSNALDRVDENGIDRGDEVGLERGAEDETRRDRALFGPGRYHWTAITPANFRSDVPAGKEINYVDLGSILRRETGACRNSSYPAYRVRVVKDSDCAQTCEDDPKCVAIEWNPARDCGECRSRRCNNCEIFHDEPNWVECKGPNSCGRPKYVCMVRRFK